MYKYFIFLIKIAIFGSILGISLPALASIDTIDIRVVVDRYGTGHISERWKVDVYDDMTEWYLSMKNLDGMSIKDFRVYDNDERYYLSDDTPWVVDRSREGKAGKSGINALSDGYELCWGVGTSGSHCWTAEYKLEGLVKKFNDGCGFNHCFVNYGLSSGPQYVRTTISVEDTIALTPENTRIWAFRYHGTCQFVDGCVVAESTEPLTTEHSMVVMCLFPGIDFCTPHVVQDTIGKMKWEALKGSDYLENYSESDYAAGNNVLFKDNEDKNLAWWEYILAVIFIGIAYALVYFFYRLSVFVCYIILILLWNVVSFRPLRIFLRQKKLLGGTTVPSYFREVPAGGDLNRAFFMIDENNYRVIPSNKNKLIAAYIVRLMKFKAISIVHTEEKGKMVYRMKIAENLNLDMSNEPSADIKAMYNFYTTLRGAAGSNHILEKGELKTYLSKHPSAAKGLFETLKKDKKEDATPKEYQEVMGLKKFLEDFSMIESRGAVEVDLWDEYLVYASLYGIADQVVKDFKKYCPDYFTMSQIGAQLISESGEIISDFTSFTGVSSVSKSFAYSVSSRYGGGGGFSSSGGGGGCSGGGGGGGGR